MRKFKNLFDKIISAESLFSAWEEFRKGKWSRADVLEFERDLEPNIFQLNRELESGTYKHGPYKGFYITDPKRRHVHKAMVKDRIVHHAMFNVLDPMFEPTFIATSFSCQIGKGNHLGVEILSKMLRKESRNGTRSCYVLKCDIRKFFDNIDHDILLALLNRRIGDQKMRELLKKLVESYENEAEFMREREREFRRFAPYRGTHRKPHFPAFRQYLYE